MSIERFCQRQVCTVPPSETARGAAERMEKDGVGCLVVVDHGKPCGVLTDRQLTLEILCNRRDPGAIKVSEIASTDVETISKDASVRDATQRIRQTGLRRLPVVDKNGKLFGIITSDDLTQIAVEEAGLLARALQAQTPFERVSGPEGK